MSRRGKSPKSSEVSAGTRGFVDQQQGLKSPGVLGTRVLGAARWVALVGALTVIIVGGRARPGFAGVNEWTSLGPDGGSIGAIAAAKAELVEALPDDGLAVLNGDDARTAALAPRTRARAVLYGQSQQCHLRASDVAGHGLGINA